MCSTTHLLQSMENYQGDLADIFRASSGNASSITGDHHHHHHLPGVRSPSVHHAAPDWPDQMFHHHHQHPCSSSDHPILSYPPEGMESPPPPLNFGHPFNNLRDPLLEDLDMPPNPAAGYFISASAATATAATTNDAAAAGAAFGQKNNIVVDDDNDIIKSGSQPHSNIINHNHNHNRNIFSRMLQISPNNATTTSTTKLPLSPPPPCDHRGILKAPTPSSSPSLISTNDMINANTSSKGCLVENNALQISSPRNTGIKRRKSQAKKVVCIPAPAPANSRPTGEVVPSDLWAWRKYGQKPIKGSPYPRGYYRCSSSKGCSARKQVERSRTDPNMLVITYTSEHNHPWPTQRNALAGSTRNQPSKTHNNSNNSSKSPPPPPPAATPGGSDQGSQKGRPITSLKEEPKDPVTSTHDSTSTVFGSSMAVDHHHVDALMVKEESMEELDKEGLDHMDDHEDGEDDQIFNGGGGGGGHDQGFPALQSYRPVLPDITANHQQLMLQQHHHLAADQDFFADLGEIEADPLNLLFTHGFSGDDIENQREDDHSKSLDPFSFYDWAAAGNHINSSSTATTPSSYGDAKWPEGL